MQKKQIRKLFREKRAALSENERMKADDLILIRIQAIEFPFISNVMSFYPSPEKHEVNTFIITDYLHFKNPSLQVAYPRMNVDSQTMEAVICNPDSAFHTNEFGITEPVNGEILPPGEIELVIVPLLAFDEKGTRVGYGKGYYDRFLKECDPDCLKVGVSYFEPLPLIEDADEFDVPLDLCITPQQVYVF
jgi:5-formyltetrahydrofolate cyclo-ligase